MRTRHKYDEFGRPIKKKNLFQKIFLSSDYPGEEGYHRETYSYKQRKVNKEVSQVESHKDELHKKYDLIDKKFHKENPQYDKSAPNQIRNEQLRGESTPLLLGFMSLFVPFVGIFIGVFVIIYYNKSILKRDLTSPERIGKGLAYFGLIFGIISYSFRFF